jgi:hypothetical protein
MMIRGEPHTIQGSFKDRFVGLGQRTDLIPEDRAGLPGKRGLYRPGLQGAD